MVYNILMKYINEATKLGLVNEFLKLNLLIPLDIIRSPYQRFLKGRLTVQRQIIPEQCVLHCIKQILFFVRKETAFY